MAPGRVIKPHSAATFKHYLSTIGLNHSELAQGLSLPLEGGDEAPFEANREAGVRLLVMEFGLVARIMLFNLAMNLKGVNYLTGLRPTGGVVLKTLPPVSTESATKARQASA